MKKIVYIFIFVTCVFTSYSQRFEVRVGSMQGINAIFIGRVPATFKIGQSSNLSANFILKNARSKFSFEASLINSSNVYNSKADDYIWISYLQTTWGLFFQSGFALNEHVIFKSGMFIQRGNASNKYDITANQRQGYKHVSASNEGIRQDYFPTVIQAGVVMGLTFYGSKKQRLGLDIQVQQYGGRISDADYFMPTMKSKKMISKSARPMILMAGLNYKIQKRKRLPDEEKLFEIIW